MPKNVWTNDKSQKGRIMAELGDADCGVESCTSTVYLVKWPDGEETECCAGGLGELENGDLYIV